MNKLSETERGYIAGFIDADGSIYFKKRGKYKPMPIITISNTNLKVLEIIKELIGAGTINQARHLKRPNETPFYIYRLQNKQIIPLLDQVLDLLIVKKNKAKQALAGLGWRS